MSDSQSKSFLLKSKFSWSDLESLPQYSGKMPILKLKYPPDYDELMDYFRAIIKNEEISERVFELSGFAIEYICGNYSAWLIRRKCIEFFKKDLLSELEFVSKNIVNNEKVYQIWEHRRWIIEKIGSPLNEIEFINSILKQDNKNYHAWSYRKYLVERFDLYEKELKDLNYFFDEDIRNNSAWSQRFFVMQYFIQKNPENFKNELNFIFEKIREAPDNESSWNYLNGWFIPYNFKVLSPKNQSDLAVTNSKWRLFKYEEFKEFEEICLNIIEKVDDKCRFAYSSLISFLLAVPTGEGIKRALEYADNLMENLDYVRKNYWAWVKSNIQLDFC